MEIFNCYASAAFGLEGIVADELRALHMSNIRTENGGVCFQASAESIFFCNLSLRTCDRVYIILAESHCMTFDDLFRTVGCIDWSYFTDGSEAINITCKCTRSRLMSPRDCQSIAKKAVIESLKRRSHLCVFPETGVPLPVHLSIRNDLTRVMLNSSGESLSRRGYRTWNGEAPLRETLAAALVHLSPWKPGLPLYDPCCGTGTIIIEGALLAAGRLPGLKRAFSMESLKPFRSLPYRIYRENAEKSVNWDFDGFIGGCDIDPHAIELASRHVCQAFVRHPVRLENKSFQSVQLKEDNGVFICNPPYGERMSDQKNCRLLYHDLRELKERHPSWSLCAITSDPSFERSFGKRADRKRRLYNGRLECDYCIYF